MAQIIKTGKGQWLVRVTAGVNEKGKRRVVNKTIKGTRIDVDRYVRECQNQREALNTVGGRLVQFRGNGDWLYAARMVIPDSCFCPIKIGYTKDPDHRRLTLQANGPYPVEWIGHWPAPLARFSEKALHEHFAIFRLTGEWFHPDPSLLSSVHVSIDRHKAIVVGEIQKKEKARAELGVIRADPNFDQAALEEEYRQAVAAWQRVSRHNDFSLV